MKIVAIVVAVMMLAGVAMAGELSLGDLLKKVDNGVGYSLIDSKFNYSATIKVLESKDQKLALNVGYCGNAKNTADKAIVSVSYNLLALKDIVNVPILDLISVTPYLAIGFGRINIQNVMHAEYDALVGVNLINLKI